MRRHEAQALHHWDPRCCEQVLGKQIYLAAPSDCPLNFDGSKRGKGSASRESSSVQLLVSNDEALTFEEACIPIRFLDKVRVSL